MISDFCKKKYFPLILYEMGTFIFIHRFTPQDKLRLVEMKITWFFLWVHPCIWQFPGTEPTHWMRGQRSWASHESRPMMKVNQIDPPWPAFSIGADPLRLSIIFNNIRAVSARLKRFLRNWCWWSLRLNLFDPIPSFVGGAGKKGGI